MSILNTGWWKPFCLIKEVQAEVRYSERDLIWDESEAMEVYDAPPWMYLICVGGGRRVVQPGGTSFE